MTTNFIQYDCTYHSENFTIQLETDDKHKRSSPVVNADRPALATRVYEDLSRSVGAFGHLLPDHCEPYELAAAMAGDVMSRYTPLLTKGVIKKPRTRIPKNANS